MFPESDKVSTLISPFACCEDNHLLEQKNDSFTRAAIKFSYCGDEVRVPSIHFGLILPNLPCFRLPSRCSCLLACRASIYRCCNIHGCYIYKVAGACIILQVCDLEVRPVKFPLSSTLYFRYMREHIYWLTQHAPEDRMQSLKSRTIPSWI